MVNIMKSIFKPAFLLFVVVVTLAGCSDNNPTEGKEYTVIPTPIADAPAVVEIFSLSCDHCRSMESMIPAIEALTKIETAKTHVTFNESAQRSAYIFYTAAIQSNGKPNEEMMQDLFAYVQEGPSDLTPEQTKEALIVLFKKYQQKSPIDLDKAQHEAVYQKMVAAEILVSNTQLASVPAFLVKGKYLVNSRSHETLEDLAATIVYLNKLSE
jgi:thiol-disulfide isomerase/thioredoxin